ncbi:DUF7139 domain-containing protein [Haloarcula sp. GH36]|uniref:DUF7139 domain-containing protein n=1 Tax=Haloarcula montana TaxID=3111776 RepID=UPI002D7811F9|nr:hypothetical protein [Haloarcula sp. GH36]
MTDETDDGRLFEWYRTYIGEPDREIDVYLGFALFFGGIGLGIGAFVIGAAGQFTGAGGPQSNFVFREAAIAVGMLALPATLSSVVVLLPVGKRAIYGAVVGSAISLVGLGLFVWAYPYSWATGSGPQYSIHVLFVYGLGLASLLAATGGALVAYHIDRAKPRPGDIQAPEEDEGESYTDEEIEQDIESAMESVDLTWGGVERHEGSDLKITPSEGEVEMDVSGMDASVDRVHRSSVDEQVAGLKTVKGGEKATDRSTSTVDEQTDQLKKLRERKQAEAASESDETVLEGVLGRAARLLGRS